MDNSKLLTNEAQIHGFITVWCKLFASWTTDKLISQEVMRNVILALVCVMGTTAILIAEVQTCFWILLCVLLTLLNVCGFMYFWGLTIDIVSCIGECILFFTLSSWFMLFLLFYAEDKYARADHFNQSTRISHSFYV